MSSTGGWGVPGIGSERTVTESEILWGADQARSATLWKSGVIDGASRDAGNTPTTVLRPGLILALTSSNKYTQWNPDASDGTQNIAGILDTELRAQDFDAADADRVFRILVGRGPVKAKKLLIEGTALTSSTDEFLARRQLVAAGFVFDDDPFGYHAGQGDRVQLETGTADTLTASQNGMTLLYNNAAAVTVTLPAIKPGLVYTIKRVGDEEMVVVSPTADNVIVGNDLSADGVTFTTAGEHLGAEVKVSSLYVGGTLKWKMELPYVPFNTGLNTLTFGIQT